ncbi:hypothetical protein ACFXA2_33450 [Micromonospora chalcea]
MPAQLGERGGGVLGLVGQRHVVPVDAGAAVVAQYRDPGRRQQPGQVCVQEVGMLPGVRAVQHHQAAAYRPGRQVQHSRQSRRADRRLHAGQ